MKKTIISLIAIATLAVGFQAQAPAKAEKNWKDRAEYDLYSEIIKPDATRPRASRTWINGRARIPPASTLTSASRST